jgi:hypothetical protein
MPAPGRGIIMNERHTSFSSLAEFVLKMNYLGSFWRRRRLRKRYLPVCVPEHGEWSLARGELGELI